MGTSIGIVVTDSVRASVGFAVGACVASVTMGSVGAIVGAGVFSPQAHSASNSPVARSKDIFFCMVVPFLLFVRAL